MRRAPICYISGQDGSYLSKLQPCDSTKARRKLGWNPRTDLEGLVAMMVDGDLELAEREKRANG
jgi:GDP-D-mannose dehydratase